MYFSYCITYRDDEEQTTEKIWTTVSVSEDKKTLTNNQGVKAPLSKAFLKYKHHFHELPMTDMELNAL